MSADRLFPDYYHLPNGIECKDVAQYMSYNIGCVLKYIWRYGRKHEEGISDINKAIEDLQKARTYLDFEIAKLTAEMKPPVPFERIALTEEEFLKVHLKRYRGFQYGEEVTYNQMCNYIQNDPRFRDYYSKDEESYDDWGMEAHYIIEKSIEKYKILEWTDISTLRLTSKSSKS